MKNYIVTVEQMLGCSMEQEYCYSNEYPIDANSPEEAVRFIASCLMDAGVISVANRKKVLEKELYENKGKTLCFVDEKHTMFEIYANET